MYDDRHVLIYEQCGRTGANLSALSGKLGREFTTMSYKILYSELQPCVLIACQCKSQEPFLLMIRMLDQTVRCGFCNKEYSIEVAQYVAQEACCWAVSIVSGAAAKGEYRPISPSAAPNRGSSMGVPISGPPWARRAGRTQFSLDRRRLHRSTGVAGRHDAGDTDIEGVATAARALRKPGRFPGSG